MLVKNYSTRQIFKALEKKNERKVETFKVVMNKCISFIEKKKNYFLRSIDAKKSQKRTLKNILFWPIKMYKTAIK